jgi:cysteine-rich repeat protein
VLDAGEACDDGNELDGDCCSAVCQFESAATSGDDACTTGGTCDGAGSCTGGTPVCDDTLFCNGAETCDPGLGCQAGTPPPIDDGVACTVDSCDEVGDVVVNMPTPSLCDDTLFCNGAEVCDPVLDCQAGTPPPIDDGVACTVDSCDEVGDVVINTPTPSLCDDTLFCNGVETCDPVLDCQAGTPPPANDGVACTVDSCDEVGDVIVHTPSDPLCDNGLFCDGAETCDPVLDCQAGTPPPIDDGVACTVDSCDEVGDFVLNMPDDSQCDNSLFCDGDEICDPLLDCQAGMAPPIDDGVACTNDSCDEINDVVVNMPDDSQCTSTGGPCTAPICDPVLGCTNVPIPGCTVEVPIMPMWGRALLILFFAFGSVPWARSLRVPGNRSSADPR